MYMGTLINFIIGWLTKGQFCKVLPNGQVIGWGNCVNFPH